MANDFDDEYDEDDEDTQKDKFLTFCVGSEVYGIEICHVIEIIGVQKITEVPDMPDFVRGVINLRGQVIPVMDVRLRFSMEKREYDERTCFVVVNIKEVQVGFIVDTVSEVVDIKEDAISPPPKIAKGESTRYIKGMGKIDEQVKILLDVESLLFDEKLAQLVD